MAENVSGESKSKIMAQPGKYLTFQLAGEIYGLEILKVQEIIGLMKVTRVPLAPGFVRGVINLRGKVIPVVDLRLKFSMDMKEDTDRTCIIVVQVSGTSGNIIMGIIVDEVSEVMDIAASQLEPAPSFGSSVDTAFILGIGKVGDRVVMLLDVNRVLTGDEIAMMEHVG
ncbi:MAG: chemotaxis protein CheW [Candidatus Wallbacteria bacterium HGW-Wallbacteria-1]|jgi:purine-binding chemotaxis protein CheW|uniref:Chemotaxis protein CheW n=1 Tax=Candidatus Wallbacteria bacterium HGW-Wallbacteria-1 TaxID=2013854 RepID=A0A2N1PNI3_9BACT|nr:MAG: chemotaxis protein CheW [Candidatus Wallbacteria bacterium HGW-Wallbacteria-1]